MDQMIVTAGPQDGPFIHDITAHAGVFSQEEVECVDELWEEYSTQGSAKCGYFFIVDREEDGRVLGYACYGPRALTDGTYDLYWIAVDSQGRRGGVGRGLLSATEAAVKQLGGRLLFVETSGLPKYAPTRAFYLGTGYTEEAIIKDFYAPGDDLFIYTKHL
jgi:ribosomal protein S18 acetylase RimI-like enzyme